MALLAVYYFPQAPRPPVAQKWACGTSYRERGVNFDSARLPRACIAKLGILIHVTALLGEGIVAALVAYYDSEGCVLVSTCSMLRNPSSAVANATNATKHR